MDVTSLCGFLICSLDVANTIRVSKAFGPGGALRSKKPGSLNDYMEQSAFQPTLVGTVLTSDAVLGH